MNPILGELQPDPVTGAIGESGRSRLVDKTTPETVFLRIQRIKTSKLAPVLRCNLWEMQSQQLGNCDGIDMEKTSINIALRGADTSEPMSEQYCRIVADPEIEERSTGIGTIEAPHSQRPDVRESMSRTNPRVDKASNPPTSRRPPALTQDKRDGPRGRPVTLDYGLENSPDYRSSAQRAPQRDDLYEFFLHEQIKRHTYLLTVTIRDEFQQESDFNRRARLESTVRHLLYRLGRKCFRRRHKRDGHCVSCAVVIERGRKLERIHAHITLARPQTVSEGEFREYVQTVIERCRSLGREYKFTPITDSLGLASYLAKDGPDAFSTSCTQRA